MIPTTPACRPVHKGVFDFVVVATGLFNKPERPTWAEGLVRQSPPPVGPWVVDAKDFTDASVAQVNFTSKRAYHRRASQKVEGPWR